MITVILVIHLILAIALVGVVLLQRSEGGALGIGGGGGGGGMSGFMTGRSTTNLLTRATAILATLFICTSLALAKLAGTGGPPASILDTPMPPAQEQPAEPAEPAAPLAR
ncbi:MAG: preprotein translocase subunit SecG [Rhodospirillales bacterium]|nr:MAG: preprotein translocase subunit SecG [Rhodospirillales bacterium]